MSAESSFDASRAGTARTASVGRRKHWVMSKPSCSSTALDSLREGDLARIGAKRDRYQQRLYQDRTGVEAVLDLLVQDALVRRMHVDEHQPALVLREDVDAVELGERKAERVLAGALGRGNAGKRGGKNL